MSKASCGKEVLCRLSYSSERASKITKDISDEELRYWSQVAENADKFVIDLASRESDSDD